MRKPLKNLPRGYVTVDEAARRLRITKMTVRAWAESKRIKARLVKVVEWRMILEAASFRDAFKTKCQACGRFFRAKHPERAEYCDQHKTLSARKRLGLKKQVRRAR